MTVSLGFLVKLPVHNDVNNNLLMYKFYRHFRGFLWIILSLLWNFSKKTQLLWNDGTIPDRPGPTIIVEQSLIIASSRWLGTLGKCPHPTSSVKSNPQMDLGPQIIHSVLVRL